MKTRTIAALLIGLGALDVSAQDATLKTDKDKTSYAAGVDIGRNLHSIAADVEVDQMVRGLRDGLNGATPALPEQDLRRLIAAYRAELGHRQQQAMQRALVENMDKGAKFQAEYRKREDVTALPDGLMYRVLRAGGGKTPRQTDTVSVNYSGRLIDGTEFDASETGKPASFKLNGGVIQGWREALLQMPVGSKWEIVMPPAVAYGDRGAGHDIPPGATLIFEVELLSILEPIRPPAASR
jgi:FKBP-type peptidyl-prolyl cis-trans isomerase